eukprot:GHVU01122845.1.p1 GENE.GHVU01122845.1~~GHVU01122845.1.p1  ORF type:complete len:268 (-),score=49.01 GHVU01122845.1:754-1557(-)
MVAAALQQTRTGRLLAETGHSDDDALDDVSTLRRTLARACVVIVHGVDLALQGVTAEDSCRVSERVLQPTAIAGLSDEEFNSLLVTYRGHMSHSFVYEDYRELRRQRRALAAALENATLKEQLEDHEGTQPFGRAWTVVSADYPLLAYFASGLACPATSTAGVERDQGRQKLLLGNLRTSMKDHTLDGLLHATQLDVLRELAAESPLPVVHDYMPTEEDFDIETEDDLGGQEGELEADLETSEEEPETDNEALSSDYDVEDDVDDDE